MKKLLILLLSFFFFSSFAKDVEVQLLSVDTALVYRDDGYCDITMKSTWNVSSGSLSSFYFSGEKIPVQFNVHKSWAEAYIKNEKKRFPLEILPVSRAAYDIIIADGISLSGQVEFVITYRVNLASIGQSSLVYDTNSQEEKNYFYFNWEAVQWEYPVKTRTTKIVFPIAIETIEDFEKLGVSIFNETQNNTANIERSLVQGIDNKKYLALSFKQENLRARESQAIHLYFDADSPLLKNTKMLKPSVLIEKKDSIDFASMSKKSIQKNNNKKSYVLFWLLLFTFILFLIFIPLYYLIFKKKNDKEKQEKKEVLKILFPYKNTKKPIEAIHSSESFLEILIDEPIEVAFLFELPIQDFTYIFLETLYLNNFISYVNSSILKIKKTAENLDVFEKNFLECFLRDGTLSLEKLENFYNENIQNFTEKYTKETIKKNRLYWQEKLFDFELLINKSKKQHYNTYWWILSHYMDNAKEDSLVLFDVFFNSPVLAKIRAFFQ